MTKDEILKTKLRNGFLYLEFIKKNGELRKMWCTRDNIIIKKLGHDLVQFNHKEMIEKEKRYKHLVHVFDLQELDTRIVNIRTLDENSIVQYKSLDDVEIPYKESRFEKQRKRKERLEKKKMEETSNLDKEIEKLGKDIDLESLFD